MAVNYSLIAEQFRTLSSKVSNTLVWIAKHYPEESAANADTTILVVEDDPVQSALLKQIIESLGYDVRLATSVKSARDCVDREPGVKLVIVDMYLGDEFGVELIKHIRSTPSLSKLPIIATTAQASKQLVDQVKGLKINGFLAKPMKGETLRELLNTTLSRN